MGPVNTQPKGLLSHAYEIGGSTEVLAPVPLRHIGQAEACVCLHILTDPGLRGQETGLRHTPSQLRRDRRTDGCEDEAGQGTFPKMGWAATPGKLPGEEAQHGSGGRGFRKRPSLHVCHHRYTYTLTYMHTQRMEEREGEEREKEPVTHSL